MQMKNMCSLLSRRKLNESTDESKLNRCLTLIDLILIISGATFSGVYLVIGYVSHSLAGPSVIISFLIAGIAASMSGLCYAEFSARVSKAGSAYSYSYVTVGEFCAFTIGWNLILEYIIGSAASASGLSIIIDNIFNNTISQTLETVMPINVNFIGKYPDFLSFLFIIIITILLAVGIKESKFFNNFLAFVNLSVLVIIFITGIIYAKPSNWTINKNDIPKQYQTTAGNGGFMPFGIAGILAGAPKCFFAYIGFDAVTTTSEEAINPKRNIPFAIIISLILTFFFYIGISTVLTMMIPYYEINGNSPFQYAFEQLNMIEIEWIAIIGSAFSLSAALLALLIPLPRILYSMSDDGLIFGFFQHINSYTKTPLNATITSGILAGLMALLFDLNQLVDMMSIGTLLAFTIVSMCVIILRYKSNDLKTIERKFQIPYIIKQMININKTKLPNKLSSIITNSSIVIFFILSAFVSLIMRLVASELFSNQYWSISIISILLITMLLTFLIIYCQPIDKDLNLTFKVPLVPILPCFSIFMNVYLMSQLDVFTWIRFAIWLSIGYSIYFGYGIRNSKQSINK